MRHTGKRVPKYSEGLAYLSRPHIAEHLALAADVSSRSELKYDEKELVELKATTSMSRRFLGTRLVHLNTGTRTAVQTNGASVMNFSVTTAGNISCTLTTTTVPELATILLLFDEFKVCGVKLSYQPLNPFNRGAAVASNPIVIGWDDEANLSPTNTLVGTGALVNRDPLLVHFSPDHSMHHVFYRPSSMGEYDWTPASAIGSVSSTFGSLFIGGDGTNTASTVYGYLNYQFMLQLRVRV